MNQVNVMEHYSLQNSPSGIEATIPIMVQYFPGLGTWFLKKFGWAAVASCISSAHSNQHLFKLTVNCKKMKKSSGERSGAYGGFGTTGERSSWRVTMEPLERESGPKGACGATRKRSGCMVAVEPQERDQVVWWLWNHRREIRLYGGCGTIGERSGCMVAVEPQEFYYLQKTLNRGHHKHISIFMLKKPVCSYQTLVCFFF